MSYFEAKAAGIPIGKLPNGMTAYYPPCSQCGTQVLSVTYNPSKNYTCADCRRLLSILERTERKIAKLECADVPKKCAREFTKVHSKSLACRENFW